MIRAAALLLALATCAPAHAQAVCGPTWQVLRDLRAAPWQEAPLVAMVPQGAPEGVTLELWVNIDTGTWTLLRRDGRGLACLLSVGEGLDPYAMRGAG